MPIKLNDVQMDKFAKLETLKSLLKEAGILEGRDYILSLQGPTIIGTVEGSEKLSSLEKSSRQEIESMGVQFLIG